MPTLADTSLSDDERALLERFAEVLRDQLGDSLHAVWVYGSRARGEVPAHGDSDVDVLVLVDDASWAGKLDLERLTPWFGVHVHTPEWLAGRRAIKSFFIAEVDRDKVVVL
jgi:predicted nucleotidyltransferase